MNSGLIRTSASLLAVACGPATPAPSTPEPAPMAPAPDAGTPETVETPAGPVLRASPEPGPVSDFAKKLAGAEGRTPEDLDRDARRHPGELLTFIGVQPGWRVGDLGAGDGYTTELLARAVGSKGVVYAQNNAYTLERFVEQSWPARLKREVNANVVRVDREYDDPLPDEAKDLDLVTILFSYHDVVAQGHDPMKVNVDVRGALKPGGLYVIADHSARPDAGPKVASELHRIPERLVREQVEAAGFELVDEAHFLRDLEDALDKPSFSLEFETDRFLLKYRKPNPAEKREAPLPEGAEEGTGDDA